MAQTLYDKLWNSHIVREEEDGTVLLYIDRHLVHEVTSPQAFEGLKMAGRKLWRIDSVVSTADHNTPTGDWDKGIQDPISKLQVDTLDSNIKEFGALAYFPFMDKGQGIVHVMGPEQGATLPGMTVVCERFAHIYSRGVWRVGARHRHIRSRTHDGNAMYYREKIQIYVD